MKRVVVFFITLSALIFASCSSAPKKFSKNEEQISMDTICKGELDYENPDPIDTLFVSEKNGVLYIYRPHYITSTHRDFIPTLEIDGDTLYISDTNTYRCYCQSEFETKYYVKDIPYGKYVLIFGFMNAEEMLERKADCNNCRCFPPIEIDYEPNMQPVVIVKEKQN